MEVVAGWLLTSKYLKCSKLFSLKESSAELPALFVRRKPFAPGQLLDRGSDWRLPDPRLELAFFFILELQTRL